VVIAACELKSLRIPARCPSARGFDRTDEGEIFKHRGDMRPSKAIVAMSAFRFYQHQATSEKLAQMRAGRLRCYASRPQCHAAAKRTGGRWAFRWRMDAAIKLHTPAAAQIRAIPPKGLRARDIYIPDLHMDIIKRRAGASSKDGGRRSVRAR
jgi:hypothetical protein